MKSKLTHYTLSTLKIISISSLTIFTLYSAQAVWTPPPQSAPNGNVGGPLTTATTSQVKTGGLGLMGGLSVSKLVTALEGMTVIGTTTTTRLKVTNGAGEGRVLVSDANGNASWTATSSLGASSSASSTLSSYSVLPQGGVAGWCFEDSYQNYTSSVLPAKKVAGYTKSTQCYGKLLGEDGSIATIYALQPIVSLVIGTPLDTTITDNGLAWPDTCYYTYGTQNVCGCESGFTSRLTGTLHPGVGTMVDYYYTCVKN